jgi:hypothetical protein
MHKLYDNLDEAKAFAISNSRLKSANGDGDAVIIFRASAVNATLTLTNTTLVGTPEISGATSATTIGQRKRESVPSNCYQR